MITNRFQVELRRCLTSVLLVFYQRFKGIIIPLVSSMSICGLLPQNQASKQSNDISETRPYAFTNLANQTNQNTLK